MQAKDLYCRPDAQLHSFSAALAWGCHHKYREEQAHCTKEFYVTLKVCYLLKDQDFTMSTIGNHKSPQMLITICWMQISPAKASIPGAPHASDQEQPRSARS